MLVSFLQASRRSGMCRLTTLILSFLLLAGFACASAAGTESAAAECSSSDSGAALQTPLRQLLQVETKQLAWSEKAVPAGINKSDATIGQPKRMLEASLAALGSNFQNAPTILLEMQRFAVAVPISVARFVVVCFPLGLTYLLALWKQIGMFSNLRAAAELGEKETKAFAALGFYLLMLVSMDLVIKVEAEKGQGQYATSPLVMVPLVELGKLVASVTMQLVYSCMGSAQHDPSMCREPIQADSGAGPVLQEVSGASAVLSVILRMLPVAAIYNLNNFLVFAVLATINLDSYAVWRNVSILFNAFLWVWMLNKRLAVNKWIALVLCLIACCLNSLHLDGNVVLDLPVAGVILSAFLSSVASVFNEYVIKARSSCALSLDQVNVILYAETLSLMLFGFGCTVAFGGSQYLAVMIDHFKNITGGGIRIILMQVILGLSVSRVLKFADSVSKTVVGSLRDVFVVFLAPFFVVGTRFDWVALGSVAWMALSGMIYFTPVRDPEDLGAQK